MASTSKTANLDLNQWSLNDKPEMADFNADNTKIDTVVSAHLAESVQSIGLFQRDSTLTGAQKITLGFKPKAIMFIASVPGQAGKASWGIANATNSRAVLDNNNNTVNTYTNVSASAISIVNTGNNVTNGSITIQSDGFTINWTHLNTGATGTIAVNYLALTHGK